MEEINNTQYFKIPKEPEIQVSEMIARVYEALLEKGYNPVSQIIGYI
ncbi:MAG: IreB family regulatory phosphoprotein, partial [Clostridium sp.]|nr:IreB family regulatory phosphoprotein [Clostridium sp.]